MSAPIGDIHDEGAKIHAFKRHLAKQPIDPATRRLLPLKIKYFFESGQIDQAINEGDGHSQWYH